MLIFGITGGTGAGKTSALRVLEKLGAYLIDCDALYYEMLRPGTELHTAIGEAFGWDVYDGSGALDRQKLGDLVFSQPAELQKLNAIICRYLCAELDRRIEAQRRAGTPYVAVDGINMIQARRAGAFRCDCMVGVVAPDALRLRRIMARDGISEEYAQKRIDAQQGNDFYWENCDAVLENVYEDPQTFERAVQRFFEELIRIYGKENQLS